MKDSDGKEMTIEVYQGDLPDDLDLGKCVAIDTEAMGLNPLRDRLCLVQISSGDGNAHLIQFPEGHKGVYDAPNLVKLLEDPDVTKLFHYARFDVAILWVYLNVLTTNVYCTKIASRIARTFTQHHSLKTLCKELTGTDLSKQQQCSDWGSMDITDKQKEYAASDVLYLHEIKEKLDIMLKREGREELLIACNDFVPHRAVLDVAGWAEEDIFAHH